MKISKIAKYIGLGILSTSLVTVVIHSHNDEPLSDINKELATADTDNDNILTVDEWVRLLSKYDKNNDGQFSQDENKEAEKLLEGTFIESYHYNIRKTVNNFYLARELFKS